MKIRLLCVGKLRSAPLKRVCDDYAGRLRRYGAFEIREVKDASARTPEQAVDAESVCLLKALNSSDSVLVLDERGKELTSRQLARRISELELRSTRALTLVLGGAHGLSDAVRARGELLALSKLTFPHELCRAVLLEQLYRARTIQRGEPYHH